MKSIRGTIAQVALLIIIGAGGLVSVTSRPRLAGVHTVDIVQLLGCGACFGVAMAIIGFSRVARSAPH